MNVNPPPLPLVPAKRPALVWVISSFYFLSSGWVILSFFLIYSGLIPLNDAARSYFKSLTLFDHGLALLIGAANLVGAVLLFLLRRQASFFLIVALGVGLAATLYQIVAKNWLGAMPNGGLVGAFIGWGINVAIIVYSRRLAALSILR